MWVFFQTLDPRTPKWRLEESIIGTNPGLGFRPMPSSDNVESTLIWFRGTERENYKYWAESLEEFLAGEEKNTYLLANSRVIINIILFSL